MNYSENNSICVIGLGYIGLPTALIFSQSGFKVMGYDSDQKRVSQLNSGDPKVSEPGLKDLLLQALESGMFKPYTEIQSADAYFICVPTPLDDNDHANLDAVYHAIEDIKVLIKPGDLVVLESTSPVGTTREIYNILMSSLKGDELFMAYCPERVLPGKLIEELSNLDRVIGGVNEASSKAAKRYFSAITSGKCYETDAEIAEFVKLSENTYRDINIAYANQLKNLCDLHKVDMNQVRRFANMHPRVNILQSGIGVGGHCIPIDPWFLAQDKKKEDSSIIQTARKINDDQPLRVAEKIIKMAHEHNFTSLALYGLTYKENVDDFRESPALLIANLITKDVTFNVDLIDPYIGNITDTKLLQKENTNAVNMGSSLAQMHVFLTAHQGFKEYSDKLSASGTVVLSFCN